MPVFVSMAMSDPIVTSLQSLSRSTALISSGDFKMRAPVETGDEVGDLT